MARVFTLMSRAHRDWRFSRSSSRCSSRSTPPSSAAKFCRSASTRAPAARLRAWRFWKITRSWACSTNCPISSSVGKSGRRRCCKATSLTPLLPFFRSSHDGESWVASLGAVLDGATLLMTTVTPCENCGRKPIGAATLMFRMGAHTVIDLSHWFGFRFDEDEKPPVGVERGEFDMARANNWAAPVSRCGPPSKRGPIFRIIARNTRRASTRWRSTSPRRPPNGSATAR